MWLYKMQKLTFSLEAKSTITKPHIGNCLAFHYLCDQLHFHNTAKALKTTGQWLLDTPRTKLKTAFENLSLNYLHALYELMIFYCVKYFGQLWLFWMCYGNKLG
ncbi:hypothetical protein XENOCAPTIV_026583 [Xenoophorus captivus]|uniref:Uncharacterized protein n=1 Tax=Xenoophorus captivus TaxID=1517983 RepID=A0ABV0QEN0_9TELE